MKLFFAAIALMLSFSALPVQADPETSRILKDAEESNAALVAGNFDRIVDFTYPKLVEMIGGRDKMLEILRRGTEDMKAHDTAILGADISEPKEATAGGSLRFAIVPMVVKVKVPQGTLRSKSFLIAVSSDGGQKWTFVDGANLTKEMLAQLLPDFPAQLSLPTREQPVLEPK